MGLNIGIEVKKQTEGYGNDGFNPKGTIEEIEKRFFDYLYDKYPLGGFSHGWVSERGGKYDFDLRMSKYGTIFKENYPEADIYLAITEFIYQEFSHIEGIDMRTYWSG